MIGGRGNGTVWEKWIWEVMQILGKLGYLGGWSWRGKILALGTALLRRSVGAWMGSGDETLEVHGGLRVAMRRSRAGDLIGSILVLICVDRAMWAASVLAIDSNSLSMRKADWLRGCRLLALLSLKLLGTKAPVAALLASGMSRGANRWLMTSGISETHERSQCTLRRVCIAFRCYSVRCLIAARLQSPTAARSLQGAILYHNTPQHIHGTTLCRQTCA